MNNTSSPDKSVASPVAIHVNPSLVQRAKAGDESAMVTIFRQFLPPDETISWVGYLGFHGWIWGRHSIGCLTNRRVADVTVGFFGEVIYQDGYLEYVNSGVVHQPSRLGLYLMAFVVTILSFVAGGILYGFSTNELDWSALIALVVAVILTSCLWIVGINMVVRLHYAFNKCGLVLAVKGGVNVYVMADRKRLPIAMAMYRMASNNRDGRVQTLGHLG